MCISETRHNSLTGVTRDYVPLTSKAVRGKLVLKECNVDGGSRTQGIIVTSIDLHLY